MFRLIPIELFKIFRKWRTYIGFIAIGILIPAIIVGFYFAGSENMIPNMNQLQKNFMITGNLFNGYTVSYMIMFSLYIHIPFLIVLVGGDILAGEATAGTYRLLLSRPVSRFEIITAKFIAGMIYVFLLIFFLAIISLGLGTLMLGSGVLIVAGQKLTILAQGDVLWRFAFAYLFAILGMTVIFGLSFVISGVVENAIGPIIATMAIIIVFSILSALQLQFMESIHPYLFTNYLTDWNLLFDYPINTSDLSKSTLILGGHVIFLWLLAYFIFKRKDITT